MRLGHFGRFYLWITLGITDSGRVAVAGDESRAAGAQMPPRGLTWADASLVYRVTTLSTEFLRAERFISGG